MDRKEFLSLLGIGAAGVMIPACLGSCSKDTTNNAPTITQFTLDLNKTEYKHLLIKGEMFQFIEKGITIAYGLDGNYYAVQYLCPHGEGGKIKVDNNSSTTKFQCDNHTTNFFTTSGSTNGSKTDKNLTTYKTSFDNTSKILTIG